MRLLLDDIFDKLDELRIAQLMQLTTKQIFLADARLERSKKILGEMESEQRFFEQMKG
jgi:DNA replication and repair protein RecF